MKKQQTCVNKDKGGNAEMTPMKEDRHGWDFNKRLCTFGTILAFEKNTHVFLGRNQRLSKRSK